MPTDSTFLEETEEVLKIDSYLRRKGGTVHTEKIEEIKVRKSRELVERRDRVKFLVTQAMRNAEIFVNSQKIDVKEK